MDFLFILDQKKKDIQTLTLIAKIMVFSKQKLKHSYQKFLKSLKGVTGYVR